MTIPSASSRRLLAVLVSVAFLAACGGGGGGSSVPAVTNTATPAATSSGTVTAGASAQTATLAQISSGYSGSITVPAVSSGSGSSVTATLENSLPGGVPAPASIARAPQAIGGTITPLVYVAFTVTSTVTFSSTPGFTFTLPAGTSLAAGSSAYVAFYSPSTGWKSLLGPGSVSGQTITFAAASGSATTLTPGTTYVFCLYSTSTASPTSTPTSSNAATAYTCPTSATSFAVARTVTPAEAKRRGAARPGRDVAATTGRLAVTYDRSTARSAASAVQSGERNAGATLVQELDFPATNSVVRILNVPAGQVAAATAALRAQSGVRSVDAVGRRHRTTVTAGYFPNDPYFNGFSATQNSNANNANPSTQAGPYYESAGVPGQWDMHAIGLEKAFAYSQSGNGSGLAAVPGALGSSSVKIAIIDTGVDPNHPELSGKLAYQKCFITNPTGVQSTGSFSTDPDGHGTDVAGIAAAQTGNGLGFVGAGGNVSIYGYRVFPTPDDNCVNDNNTDLQCSVDTSDIAAAINDAIAQHVNVISMSLGGGVCGTGSGFAANGDNDVTEGTAVQAAITAGIVVVAASGNDAQQGLEAPACDTGVIAVGATSLADGQPNGLGNSNGSSSAPIEYVGSYSDYGSPGKNALSASAWGIVAPGGDPSGDTDSDNLHWIEHIWTSTPFGAPSDQNFTGNCNGDYPSSSGSNDCRTLIAGTSMATPHVAGAAALIISATGGLSSTYQSPTAMKTLLCQTADDISDSHEGCGRLNVYRAMAKALGDAHLP